jgi:chorismate mutase / prephenate dehydratase
MKKFTVSFQGEYGAFSEQAAIAYFGSHCTPSPRENFRDVFNDVKSKKSSFGIIPIENSLFGSIVLNYDLLQEYPLFVIGEIKLRINHCLLTLPTSTISMIRNIYSHPQALGQCDKFLRTLKNISIHQYYDTAGAAKMIADEKHIDTAAIASEQAANHYGLKILRKNIETDHRNYTRFLIIARKESDPRGHSKTSLIFASKHAPGLLVHCLSAFAEQKINLLKIESRPIIGKPWEYLFYVDVDSNKKSPAFKKALKTLTQFTSYLKILGSYTIGKVAH